MSNPLDQILFDGKSSSDVFKEIYTNSKKKDKQINALIAELKPLIQNIGDAPVVVPLIKEYLEIFSLAKISDSGSGVSTDKSFI